MKRVMGIVAGGALAALAILYALRLGERGSTATVASLLPRGTVALAHLPDFKGLVDQWHRSDICQIYREPAVQEFLKAGSRPPSTSNIVATTARDIEELDAKDVFVALASTAPDQPKIIAGFRFRSSPEVADRVIESWRAKIKPRAKRQSVPYQQHEITLFTEGAFIIALVQDRQWVFASNDLNELKAVLDRADGRIKDRQTLLGADESYREAMDAMPGSYGLLFYLQPKLLGERLASVRAAIGTQATADQRTLFEQIRSISATTRFEDGKMHDVIFVAMPKQEENTELTRSSLALGTRATFFYVASLINLSKQVALFVPGAGSSLLGASVQKIAKALTAAGITPEDWNVAFDSESGMLVDWPEETLWPSLIFCCGVKDQARAKNIVAAITRGVDEDGQWEESDRDGVHYWSMVTTPSLIPIHPVLALSNRILVCGLEKNSVEAAMGRREKSEFELENSDVYKRAARSVPRPTNFFAYLDTGMLYSRLDATLRPMLFMGAAFVPGISSYVDLSKVPPVEVITKHLSPIVSSQRYVGKGYVAESVGPITLNQSGIGLGLLAGFGALGYQRNLAPALSQFGMPHASASPTTAASPIPKKKGTKGPTPASPQPTSSETP